MRLWFVGSVPVQVDLLVEFVGYGETLTLIGSFLDCMWLLY